MIAFGLLAALALTCVLASMLVEVKPTDPVTFVFVSVLFLLIAVIASWFPALRRRIRSDYSAEEGVVNGRFASPTSMTSAEQPRGQPQFFATCSNVVVTPRFEGL